MALNQWFKFYGGEYLSDPKIAALSAQERSCWVTLLALASISSTPGTVEYLTVEVLLEKSGIYFNPYSTDEWDKCLAVLDKFARMKMITKNEDGTIVINNWAKRQETALTNAERQARFRERNEKVTKPVTNVTLDKIRVEKKEAANAALPPSEVREVQLNSEGQEKPPKVKRAADPAWGLKEKLYDMFEEELGVRPTPNSGDYQMVKRALNTLNADEIVDMVEEELSGKKPPATVREALSDRQVDIYRQENQ